MRKPAVFLALIALWLASSSGVNAQPQNKIFGFMDDGPHACLVSDIGGGFIKKTFWITSTNGQLSQIKQDYLQQFDTDMQQAAACGVQVIIQLWPVPQYGLPKSSSQRRDTCDIAEGLAKKYPQVKYFEIGLEPNKFQFGGKQFVNGVNVSAGAYTSWLAACYDALKGVNPDITVIGGSLASTGDDNPYNPASDTSPVRFIQKMCDTYRASGRPLPLMDVLDMHTYPDPADQDPRVQHPFPSTTITIADDGKLVSTLACFKGTAQPLPPVLWGEGGYNTKIPASQMKGRYSGQKPASVGVVDEATQGRYIPEEIKMAFCQPNSVGFINLHIVDDPSLKKDWQSGLVYAPNHQEKRAESGAEATYTHKQSWLPVKNALTAVANGSMQSQCG